MGRSSNSGSVASRALDALRTIGPMTRDELQRFLGHSDRRRVTEALWRMRKTRTRANHPVKRRVRICGWETEPYPAPVYAAGSAPDVPAPGPKSVAEYTRRYRAKKAIGRGVANSVFALAESCT